MLPFDTGWVVLPLACVASVLLGCWVYVQRIVGPRNGLPIPPGPSGHWLFGIPFPKSRQAAPPYVVCVAIDSDLSVSYKLAELTKEYGPVFSLRHGPRLFVVIGRYQAAMEIMEKEGASVADRPRLIAAGEILSGGIRLITSRSGNRVRRLRRVLHVVMQPKAAETYEPMQLRHAKNLLLDILDDPGSHQMHARRFAASIVMEITYGKVTPTSYSDPEVVAVNRCLMRLGQAFTPGEYLVDTFPILRYVPGYLSKLREWRREELTLFEQQLDVVRQRMAGDTARPCFAKFIIEHQREYQIQDEEMAYLAGGMFGAGSETTASTTSIIMMAAALHPEVQGIVHEELDRVVGRERLPSFADQPMLPRLSAFILETLRWRPMANGGVVHCATKDVVWQNYVIPEGATVIANLWAIANDSDVFPNPERFDPQRWLTAEGTLRNDLRFPTFGFGRRICPGRHIANRSIFASTALLLWAFRLREDPKAPIDPFGFFDTMSRVAKPFQVVFEPRSGAAQIQDLCTARTDDDVVL